MAGGRCSSATVCSWPAQAQSERFAAGGFAVEYAGAVIFCAVCWRSDFLCSSGRVRVRQAGSQELPRPEALQCTPFKQPGLLSQT